eukprot:185542_1
MRSYRNEYESAMQHMENLKSEVKELGLLKAEIERSRDENHEKYREPVNVCKQAIKKLDAERKGATRMISARTKFIDQSNRKMRDYRNQYDSAMQQMENNEKGRKLADITKKLNEATNNLQECRSKRNEMEQKSQKTIELKQNEQQLNAKTNELRNKQYEIN